MNATAYQVSSVEDIKDDIVEQSNVLSLFRNSKIYNYKLVDLVQDDDISERLSSQESSLGDELSQFKEATQPIKDKIKDAIAKSEAFEQLAKKRRLALLLVGKLLMKLYPRMVSM